MKNVSLAIVAVGVSLVIAAAVPAISASNSSVIKGCVNKQTQVLRVATKCTSNEKSISWNAKGEKGEPGPIGSPGPAGASGSTGATGATGATGPAGATGATGPAGSGGSGSGSGQAVVLDANGNLFGYPLSVTPSAHEASQTSWASAIVLHSSSQRVLSVKKDGTPTGTVTVAYQSNDCTGQPVALNLPTNSAERYPVTLSGTTTWFRQSRAITSNNGASFIVRSAWRDFGLGTMCGQYGVGVTPTVEFPVQELEQTTAPFQNPVGPLRIVVQ
jgi:hypothetical protein